VLSLKDSEVSASILGFVNLYLELGYLFDSMDTVDLLSLELAKLYDLMGTVDLFSGVVKWSIETNLDLFGYSGLF